jgi:hypothetical protein
VGGCQNGGWFSSEAWGKPSSRCKHWMILLSGIVRVVFEPRTWWVPNVGI